MNAILVTVRDPSLRRPGRGRRAGRRPVRPRRAFRHAGRRAAQGQPFRRLGEEKDPLLDPVFQDLGYAARGSEAG